jgi:predicted DNA-binding protein (MmcQ/YjbR family)
MNAEIIREFCLEFPHATEKLQWGDDLCFKIAGKIFATLGLDNPRMCFKCSPESFAELIEREDVRPAPYVGRYKWVMLDRLDAVPWNELRDLIRQSYEMVAAKAGKRRSSTRTSTRTSKRTSKRASSIRTSSSRKRSGKAKSPEKQSRRIRKK